MIYGHSLDTGQAGDLAAWFAFHLPVELRCALMADRPLLYEALFPGCAHDVILARVAAALRSQAHDRMIKTGQPAAEHLLRLIQGTSHPWEGSDTVDAIEQFLGQFGITVPEPAEEAAATADPPVSTGGHEVTLTDGQLAVIRAALAAFRPSDPQLAGDRDIAAGLLEAYT